MAYRNFTFPEAAKDWQTTKEWMEWMREQGDILVPVAPHHDRSCRRCFGACGYRDDGDTWATCWNCSTYGDAVDTLVPITYSVDAGLESMLHQYKDRGVAWLRRPLASLLTTFVKEHADCIDEESRGIDVATIVPSNNQDRAFSHLDRLLRGVITGDPVLARFDWNMDAIERDPATPRPGRGQLRPEAYQVAAGAVGDATVLLLDDTWTSGSSAASAAAALKDAGAHHVTVLTLGRQLNPNDRFGTTEEIYNDRAEERWDLAGCAICT